MNPRALVAGAVVVAVGFMAAGVWWFLARDDDRGPDADGNLPEDVALIYVEALHARDFATMWEHGSDYEHDRRDRAAYIEFQESSTPASALPEGTTYEVTGTSFDGIWTRVTIRATPPTGAPTTLDALVEKPATHYLVTATGPQDFDLDDTPY